MGKNIEVRDYIKENLNNVAVVIFTTVMAGFLMNLFILLNSILLTNNIVVLVLNELSILLSLAIIPYIFFKRYIHTNLKFSENKIKLTFVILISILISLIFIDIETSIHFMIIAISEELLFREIYYQYLLENINLNSSKYKFLFVMLITSLIFATILHINDNFFINILVRFPLGIVLFLIRDRFKLRSAVIFHWLYNILLTVVI